MNNISRILSRCFPFVKGRYYSSDAFNHDNLKKIQLTKKVASSILFGSTLLLAIWCKKRRRVPEAFLESTLLPKNDLYHSGLKLYNYKGFVLPVFVMKKLGELKNFVCREDDIFVLSFPKTGTTWLQEIVYCIVHEEDFEVTSKKNIEDRFPYLEFVYPGLATIEKQKEQRFIKTHLPFSLLPPDVHQKKPKMLYIVRNPKDVTVSYFHFLRMFTMSSYTGNFNEFVQDMVADRVPFGPMWKHYSDILLHKDEHNILIVSYEDLHKDFAGSVKRIAAFLGKNLTEDAIAKISDHCAFSKMAHNPSVNYEHWDDFGIRHKNEAKFMRKGKVGDWKNYFTVELNDQMNQWIDQNMKELDVSFIYE